MILDRLIDMDDVSDLADRSEEFVDWDACTFFILYIQPDNTGKWYCHSRNLFFPGSVQASSIIRIFYFLLADTSTIMSHTEVFGLIDYILKYLILDKNSGWPLTHLQNLGYKQILALKKMLL